MSSRGAKRKRGSRLAGAPSSEARAKVKGQQRSNDAPALEAVAQAALAGLPAADRKGVLEAIGKEIAKVQATAEAEDMEAQRADREQHRRERADRHEQEMKDRRARRAQSVGTVVVGLGLAVGFFVIGALGGHPAAFGGTLMTGWLSLRGAFLSRPRDPDEEESEERPQGSG